jgi:hypothetical protein
MIPMFGEIRAVNDQYPICFAERFIHQALMFGQQGLIILLAFSNELLKGTHLPVRVRSHS